MKWSLSKLGTFETCNAKYDFKYNQKHQETRNVSAQRGIDNHALIELYFKGEDIELPAPLNFYATFLKDLKGQENYPELKLSLKEDLTPCEWDDPDVWYQGVLDLLVLKRPIAYVYDWKTGKIYDDHEQQRDIYALATFARYPEVSEVRAFHVYLDTNQTRSTFYSRDKVPEMWKPWRTRVSFLDGAKIFVPNPGFHCRRCSFSKSNGGPCRF